MIPEPHKFLTKNERGEKQEEIKRLEEFFGKPYEVILRDARANEKSLTSRMPPRDRA